MRATQYVKAAAVALLLIAAYLLVRTGPLAPAHGISSTSRMFMEDHLT